MYSNYVTHYIFIHNIAKYTCKLKRIKHVKVAFYQFVYSSCTNNEDQQILMQCECQTGNANILKIVKQKRDWLADHLLSISGQSFLTKIWGLWQCNFLVEDLFKASWASASIFSLDISSLRFAPNLPLVCVSQQRGAVQWPSPPSPPSLPSLPPEREKAASELASGGSWG